MSLSYGQLSNIKKELSNNKLLAGGKMGETQRDRKLAQLRGHCATLSEGAVKTKLESFIARQETASAQLSQSAAEGTETRAHMTSEADRIIEALGGSVDSKGKAAVPAASSVAPIEEPAATVSKNAVAETAQVFGLH